MSATRRQVCEGCWRRCAFRDFRGQVPTKPGDRGAGPWGTFGDEGSSQQRRLTEVVIPGGAAGGVSRGTILGELHGRKQASWDRATAGCPFQGQRLPRTTEDALVLASRLPATVFRVRFLGMSYEKARAIRQGLSLAEFLSWWAEVGRNRELPLYPPCEEADGGYAEADGGLPGALSEAAAPF